MTTRSGHAVDAETLAVLLGQPKAKESEDRGAAAARAGAGLGARLTEGGAHPPQPELRAWVSPKFFQVNPGRKAQWPGCGVSLSAQLTGGGAPWWEPFPCPSGRGNERWPPASWPWWPAAPGWRLRGDRGMSSAPSSPPGSCEATRGREDAPPPCALSSQALCLALRLIFDLRQTSNGMSPPRMASAFASFYKNADGALSSWACAPAPGASAGELQRPAAPPAGSRDLNQPTRPSCRDGNGPEAPLGVG